MLRPLLIALCLMLLPFAPVAAEDSPGALVQAHSQKILDELDANREAFRASPDRLQQFIRTEMDQLFDRDYSARLVLGRHSRSADPQQISAFGEALTNNLLNRYGSALLDVDPGLKVKVRAETPLRDGSLMRVATEIERRNGQPVPVDYMFRQTDEGWRAFDVIVEGVSYVQTYRNQFDELLRRDSLQAVTMRLADGSLDVAD